MLAVVVGAFAGTASAAAPGWITSCAFSHSSNDDPIVFPGISGAAHLHDFVGATTTSASSTPQSLRAGGTLCHTAGDATAYWVPALYVRGGQRVVPSASGDKDALFYYRRVAAPSGYTVPLIPDGLKMIMGNANATGPYSNPNIIWKCGPGSGTNLAAPPAQCGSGVMVVSLKFPNCWDGRNLDSPNHLAHMAYPSGGRCPSTHPVVLPRVESFFRYTVGTAALGEVRLASGGYWTIHQDILNAWEPASLQRLLDQCINAGVDCGKNP